MAKYKPSPQAQDASKILNVITTDNCTLKLILSGDVLGFSSGSDYLKFLLQTLGQHSRDLLQTASSAETP